MSDITSDTVATDDKAAYPVNVVQVSVSAEASGNHTTVIALRIDNTMWRIVHVGDYATGQWSEWEKLPPIPTV